jgi:Recombination endonuclease VII
MAVAPRVPDGHKWCRRCGETKLAEAFATHTSRPDGRQVHCRACQSAEYRRKQMAAGKVVRPPDVPEGHKFCRSCQRTKVLDDFGLRRSPRGDGRMSACKECRKVRSRADYLKREYGITEDAVADLLRSQAGVCAICRTAPAVHVDHDHRSGKVRGMLCFSCNAALGHFRDEPAVLRRAARYLEMYAVKSAPGPSPSHRDEVVWEIVLSHRSTAAEPGFLEQLVPAGGPSRLEQLLAARLAELTGGPAS